MSRSNQIVALVRAAAAYQKPQFRYFSRRAKDPSIPRGNDGNKTHERKLLPAELSTHTAMLTCKSSAKGGACHVYLVGTDHSSKQSREQVQAVVKFLKPQAVFLELCNQRRNVVENPTEEFGGSYCGEFRVAYDEAMKYGARVYLGDRDVDITTHRTFAKMSLWAKKICLIQGVVRAVLKNNTLDEITLWNLTICVLKGLCRVALPKLTEMVKKTDNRSNSIWNIDIRMFPYHVETVLHERDQYLSATLLQVSRQHNSVVAVVGRDHLQGIQNHWEQPIDMQQLLSIPAEKKRKPVGEILVYIGATVVGVAIAFIHHQEPALYIPREE